MIDIFFNCFNSFNFYLILFFAFIFYFVNKRSRNEEINKAKEKEIVDSIPRRSEECPQTYPNGWLPVYDSRDLKKGEVKPIFALGRDLVIYRGTSGKVNVFDAYCPHLGANLGVGGTVVGDDIKCHFHGWEFNSQGDCKAIPGLEDKSIPKATIRKWRCDEVNDFIYVWHHFEGKEPDWFMEKMDKYKRFVYQGKFNKETYTHIQDILENEVDNVHFDTVHGTEKLIPKFLQSIIKFKLNPPKYDLCDAPDTHCSQTEANVYLKIGTLILFKVLIIGKAIGPARLSFDMQLDIKIKVINIIVNFNIITLDKFKQLIVIKFYSEPSIVGYIFTKGLRHFFSLVLDPDIPIWNNKRYLQNPTFTKLDDTIVVCRRWYKQFYSKQLKDN